MSWQNIIRGKNYTRYLMHSFSVHSENAYRLNEMGAKRTDTYSTTAPDGYVISGGTEYRNPVVSAGSVMLGGQYTDFTPGPLVKNTQMDCTMDEENHFFQLQQHPDLSNTAADRMYGINLQLQPDNNNRYLMDSHSGMVPLAYPVNSMGQISGSTPLPLETQGYVDIGIGEDGIVYGNYSDDANRAAIGQLALARFPNVQGLKQQGRGGLFRRHLSAGEPMEGASGSAYFPGDFVPGYVQGSNIEVTALSLDASLDSRGVSVAQGYLEKNSKQLTTLEKIG
ncbi:hypothetical protein ACFLZV_05275 [Candidatus Margulisiibacteriota bacterium]